MGGGCIYRFMYLFMYKLGPSMSEVQDGITNTGIVQYNPKIPATRAYSELLAGRSKDK